ncbi:MAG: serine/threonine-protein kinase [Ignavibacteriaceae bacterium]
MNPVSTEILFDKFEVVECLKKDSHTCVYLANHIYLGKKIILKTLNTDNLPDKTILERFKREAKILAQLEHPNLIKVLDFGTHSHFFYISFEHFDSRNLREVIKDDSLSVEDKNQLIIQLLKALNAAHQNQVIHRDIKPENILVNNNFELKIADFGLALIQNDHGLTQKSSIVGTPSYMSPEQIRGEALTPQSDLFSAGIVCYELLTGKNPLLGKDISETINKILNFDESVLEIPGHIPEQIRDVILNMLKKNLSLRIKSAADALNTLGINATIYNIPKEEVPAEKKKINVLYYIIPAAITLILITWLLATDYIQKNSNNAAPAVIDTSGTGLNEPSVSENPDTAKLSETNQQVQENISPSSPPLPSNLNIDVNPWARVFVDNESYGETPLRQTIQLKPGTHTIRLENDNFPSYTQRVILKAGETRNLKINFNNVVGYLEVKIEPWGDVYINNEYKGESSSLKGPIVLLPGRYKLLVSNPYFGKQEKRIHITAQQTTTFELNFNSL